MFVYCLSLRRCLVCCVLDLRHWCDLLFVVDDNGCFKCDAWLDARVGFGYASVLVGYWFVCWLGFV